MQKAPIRQKTGLGLVSRANGKSTQKILELRCQTKKKSLAPLCENSINQSVMLSNSFHQDLAEKGQKSQRKVSIVQKTVCEEQKLTNKETEISNLREENRMLLAQKEEMWRKAASHQSQRQEFQKRVFQLELKVNQVQQELNYSLSKEKLQDIQQKEANQKKQQAKCEFITESNINSQRGQFSSSFVDCKRQLWLEQTKRINAERQAKTAYDTAKAESRIEINSFQRKIDALEREVKRRKEEIRQKQIIIDKYIVKR